MRFYTVYNFKIGWRVNDKKRKRFEKRIDVLT